MKICDTCKITKDLNDFHIHPRGVGGKSGTCKECAKSRSNKWYHDNLDRTKAQRKEYREANKGVVKAQKRRYYLKNKEIIKVKSNAYFKENHEDRLEKKRIYHHKNKERVNAKRRQWNRDNPERHNEQSRVYKAQKRNQLGSVPSDYLENLWIAQEGMCYYCQGDLGVLGKHVEHMVPLSRGGLHDISNLCLACPDCNLSKGIKTAEEFSGKRYHNEKS